MVLTLHPPLLAQRRTLTTYCRATFTPKMRISTPTFQSTTSMHASSGAPPMPQPPWHL
jgi:hypothetical protein